jgi:endonuclease/exonuclease/phosphatase family metal-dependent hydrolase
MSAPKGSGPAHRSRRPALAVYNVHSGVGSDGLFDAERVLEVIRGLSADVVALNEVDSRRELGREGQMAQLFQHHLGGELIEGPTLREQGGEYGNALLTLWPVLRTRLFDLSCDGREPRSLIDCVLEAPFGPLRVLVTHLGLRAWERRRQIGRLTDIIEGGDDLPAILAGDLNEWSPLAPAQRRLREVLARVRRRGTFPARFPLLPLDQVWCRPAALVRSTRVPRSDALRRASDHLPLIAELDPDVLIGGIGVRSAASLPPTAGPEAPPPSEPAARDRSRLGASDKR